MNRDLAEFLADGGAVVGGAAAMGAVLGYVAGSIVHDFVPTVDPDDWARRGGMYFGIAGLIVFVDSWH